MIIYMLRHANQLTTSLKFKTTIIVRLKLKTRSKFSTPALVKHVNTMDFKIGMVLYYFDFYIIPN